MERTTKNSKTINAAAEKVYKAFADPSSLEIWQAPDDMTAKVHNFDFKVGGGYGMSLFYPDSEQQTKGKTADNEDRFSSRFIEIIPNRKIVQAINFESADPDFQGEMIMEVTFEPVEKGTKVTFFYKNIPKGIRPADNEAGTISSLEKLAKCVQGHRKD